MSLSKWCFRRFTPSVELRHCRSNTEQESITGNSNSDYKYDRHGLYRNYHLSGQHCLFIIHSEWFIPENGTGPASVQCHPKIGLSTVSINTTSTAHTHVSNAAGQARCTQILSHTGPVLCFTDKNLRLKKHKYLIFWLLFCVWVLYLHTTYMPGYPQRTEEDIRCPRTIDTEGWEPPCKCWNSAGEVFVIDEKHVFKSTPV